MKWLAILLCLTGCADDIAPKDPNPDTLACLERSKALKSRCELLTGDESTCFDYWEQDLRECK